MFNIPPEQPRFGTRSSARHHRPVTVHPAAGCRMAGSAKHHRARLLGLVPATLTGYFAWAFWLVSANGPFTVTVPWAPSLGLSLSFHFDGLGLLFATLIAAVGTLVVLYAADYLEDTLTQGNSRSLCLPSWDRCWASSWPTTCIALFVFWELTGFTSYLLIGFEHDRSEARRAALQALLVTGAGGLALLAAGILLWQAGGTTSLSELLSRGVELRRSPDVRRYHRADPARRVHQVCAVPIPFLAPECDAGTHTRSAPICTPRRWSKLACTWLLE